MSNLIAVSFDGKFQFFADKNGERIWDERAGTRPVSEILHDSADASETFSKCYFIGGEAGPVKIGYSVSAKDRLRDLQVCSPVRLFLLAVREGGAAREAAYHHEFRDHRLHGEWFERCPEIEAEIEAEIERLNRHAQ